MASRLSLRLPGTNSKHVSVRPCQPAACASGCWALLLPATINGMNRDGQGVTTLEQAGWRIDYQQYSDEPGAHLPVTYAGRQWRCANTYRRGSMAAGSVMTCLELSLGLPQPWPAPAKLNLCLHIVGRRADGYHLLQTAMQFIDLIDELRFFRRPDGVIERLSGLSDVPPQSDLVIRAAHLLAQHTAVRAGVAIDVVKKIPVQAGLGGGSSDAATVLVALNRLWNTNLDVDTLAQLGLRLGADVPFFIRGHAAWAEGIGEQLRPSGVAGSHLSGGQTGRRSAYR